MVPPDSDRAPPTPPYSGYSLGSSLFRVRGCHPLRPAFPGVFPYMPFFHIGCPTTPRAPRRPRFGLAPFRSPLLGGSLLFSSPPTTWMFRFVGFAPTIRGCRALARRVAPFGNLRIKGRSRLPAEYRRLPRPSSPPGATGIPRAPSIACRRSGYPPCLPLGRTAALVVCLHHLLSVRIEKVCCSQIVYWNPHGPQSLCFALSPRRIAPPRSSSHDVNEPPPHLGREKWRMWGSNPRPPACKAGALAN